MILVGGVAGAALAFALGRLGRALLFGVEGAGAPIVAAAATVVLIVSSVAALLPARRASNVNPIEALRVE